MKWNISIAALLSLLLCVANAQKPVQKIPSFSFIKMDGTIFTNAQLPKSRMLFFFCFDPDCDHCQRAAANLNQHYQEYKGTQLYMIGESDKQKINQFINRYAPVFRSNKEITILQDPQNEFPAKFQPFRYPAMFLFTANGKLADYEDNEESVFRFLTTLKKATGGKTK